MTGVPQNVHGTYGNNDYRAIPEGLTLFERFRLQGHPSAYVAGKCEDQERNMCSGRDPHGRPYPFLRVKDNTVYFKASSNLSPAELTDHCLLAIDTVEAIVKETKHGGFVFCHYQEPDWSGHHFGGASTEYADALRTLDRELGRLMARMPAGQPILLVSDHGFEIQRGARQQVPGDDPITPKRTNVWGKEHVREPWAILASNIPLLQPATNRDIAPTIHWLIEPTTPAPSHPAAGGREGYSLLPGTPLTRLNPY